MNVFGEFSVIYSWATTVATDNCYLNNFLVKLPSLFLSESKHSERSVLLGIIWMRDQTKHNPHEKEMAATPVFCQETRWTFIIKMLFQVGRYLTSYQEREQDKHKKYSYLWYGWVKTKEHPIAAVARGKSHVAFQVCEQGKLTKNVKTEHGYSENEQLKWTGMNYSKSE